LPFYETINFGIIIFPADFGGIGFSHFLQENEKKNNNPEDPVNPVQKRLL